MESKGKFALVLGGGKGLGKEIALDLAGRGVTVAISYFDWPEESTATCRQLAGLGGDHLSIRADLRIPTEVEILVNKVREKVGRLDILINNIERGCMPVVHAVQKPAP